MAPIVWVDWVLAGILASSVAVGLWRGFVFEVMSLIGWVIAYVAAPLLTSTLAPHVPIGAPGSALNQGAAFGLCFVGVLVLWGLIAKGVRMLVHATPLSLMDRALGAGFGLIRGAVLLLALATVIALTPVARASAWQSAQGATWLTAMLHALKPLLPPDLAQHLPDH